MNGYRGKILRVNLSSGAVATEELNAEWTRRYFGGKGLGYRYLFEELPVGTDPLGEKNRLILMTGPFTGTVVPCSGKLAIITRSPATGTILDCSVGGCAAAELKFAGYDGVIIEGKSPRPVFLYINNGQVLLESAASLWGRGTRDTELALRKNYGDEVKVLSIGPAGENQVPFACITSEFYRQAGRGGVGAVMGSKNLKAIVIRGSGDVQVAEMQSLLRMSLEAMRSDVHTDANLWACTDGTPMIMELSQQTGILPTNNFQQGTFEQWERLSASSVKRFVTARKGCFSCALGCGNYVRVNGVSVEGPEYETLAMAGASCGVGDLEAVARFNQLCDDLGLDTISTGSVIAYAMEMTQKGIYNFGISFGDITAYLQIPGLIATRVGIGKQLALGVRALSENYGGRDFAMHVKGLELPGYDPRGAWGMGLAYATAPRGGCHMSAWPVAEETFGEGDAFTTEGKAQMVKELQDYNAIKFSLILCDFWAASLEQMARLVTVVLGRPVSSEELQKAGERIFTLARAFNLREGFNAQDDTLPLRIFREPIPSGAASGKVLPEDRFRGMLQEYYTLRGWDETGRPPFDRLEDAGIF